jgi:hypothetical protein
MSSTATRYRIPDEPLPSGLAHVAVDPMWPLLAMMLGGSAFALPWFVLNAHAIGSPGRRGDLLLAAAGLVASVLVATALLALEADGTLAGAWLQVAYLGLVCLKLVVAYVLFFRQSPVFELWEYYGGKAKNGLVALVLMAMFGRRLLAGVMTVPLAQLVLS